MFYLAQDQNNQDQMGKIFGIFRGLKIDFIEDNQGQEDLPIEPKEETKNFNSSDDEEEENVGLIYIQPTLSENEEEVKIELSKYNLKVALGELKEYLHSLHHDCKTLEISYNFSKRHNLEELLCTVLESHITRLYLVNSKLPSLVNLKLKSKLQNSLLKKVVSK